MASHPFATPPQQTQERPLLGPKTANCTDAADRNPSSIRQLPVKAPHHSWRHEFPVVSLMVSQ